MKECIDTVKGALATKDFGTHLNHYLFEPGWVLASDGRMVAACPTGADLSCLVPGPELEAVLGRFPADVEMIHDGRDRLTIRAGHLRAVVQTLPVDQVNFYRPVAEWLQPPDGLVAALKLARPFIAEQAVQAWALCACVRTGAVVATNNMSIVSADCPALEVDGDVLMPSWAVDYVIRRAEPLTGIMWDPNYAAFKWKDDVWFRTQLVEGKFPPQIGNLIAHPERADVVIEPGWCKTYLDVAALSESLFKCAPDSMSGGKGKAAVTADVETKVSKEILFNPKFLTPVMEMAEYWGPDVWPQPVPFRGKGFNGVVVGRKS